MWTTLLRLRINYFLLESWHTLSDSYVNLSKGAELLRQLSIVVCQCDMFGANQIEKAPTILAWNNQSHFYILFRYTLKGYKQEGRDAFDGRLSFLLVLKTTKKTQIGKKLLLMKLIFIQKMT